MNKQGGFTLIELLAVIVILAIIAVIAVPIVIDIIDKSKENASLRSAEMYMDAVELSIANRTMKHGAIPNRAYEIMSDGNICLKEYIKDGETETCGGKTLSEIKKEDLLEVEVNGEAPTSGTIIIENGQIVNELNIDINKYLDAVKEAINTLDEGTYNILESGNICLSTYDSTNKRCTGDILTIEVNIAKPNSGTITKAGDNVTISGVNKNKTELVISDKTLTNNSKGELVYAKFLDEVCTYDKISTVVAKTIGAKYECDFGDGKRNFYILELGSNPVTGTTLASDEVALILEGNYDTTIQTWCASGSDNSCNADGLTSKLNDIAEAWKELEREQIVLPSALQVIVANNPSKNTVEYTEGIQSWLYNWPDNADYGISAPYGYWTSTPIAASSRSAWCVLNDGRVYYDCVVNTYGNGTRPVVNLKI